MHGLIGKKLGMTQIFDETGRVIPVTVLQVGPCVVTQLKTQERDGYEAVQLGFGDSKRLNKPERGQRKAAGTNSRYLREMKANDISGYEVGQVLDCSIFEVGARVDVAGTSKGKGFQGTVKRHGFAGGPKTHGQSDRHRAPGSIGSSATPGRVFKNMKMAGQMGNERKTVQGLEVVRVDPEKNLVLVRGSVPGHDDNLLIVRTSVKTLQALAIKR
ncbi:MAG TPA: 50S ribosomal protein L3 [Thermomicrobiales bacterium]|nr:50S ribosomal protein L3 [Thermomicrobiales bacterium]